MSDKTIYHYVYRITNLKENKHYYGCRTSKGRTPKIDLGIKYISSSHDKNFISEQKKYPENFRYKVIREFNTREDAVNFEIRLHNKFNVAINDKFYNKAKQTSTKFDTSGISNKHSIETRNKISIGNKGKCKDFIPVIDKDGNYSSVHRDDPRYLSGELVAKSKNKVSVKDNEGNSFQTDINNPRIGVSLFGVNKGLCLKSPYPRKRIYTFKDKDFNSLIDLSEYIKVERRTLSDWCTKNNDKMIGLYSYNKSKFLQSLGKDIIGKTYKEIGFSIKSIDK